MDSPRMLATACPACTAPMRTRLLERTPHGRSSVDLCDGCGGLWFDQHESLQLTPGATLELFREIAAFKSPAGRSLPARLPCPRCAAPLAETQDLQRTTRFRYWRCGRGHGRYTPYVQFLLEKSFIRALSPAELERLRSQVKSIRCSGCGAAVDIVREAACSYCRAPIVALDPEAMAHAVRMLDSAERSRTTIDVEKLADALLHSGGPATRDPVRLADGTDLVASGLALLAGLLSS